MGTTFEDSPTVSQTFNHISHSRAEDAKMSIIRAVRRADPVLIEILAARRKQDFIEIRMELQIHFIFFLSRQNCEYT